MKKFIKYTIIAIFPVLFVLFIVLSINVFVTDWRYAHKSHMVYQDPFDWTLYKSELAVQRFIRSLVNDKTKGLPAVHLYIGERSQRKLLENTPISTKKWIGGHFLLDDGNLKKIEIRHRGDNPRNWMFEKKHWRIKTRKNETFDRKRYAEYWPVNFEKFFSGSIANRMGILSPKFKLVELFINDKSDGIFIETEKLNEGFLRRNNLMPVNLYKGEQILTEGIIGTESDLFNNYHIWKKLAYFNQLDKKDKSDLRDFLSLLRNAELNNFSFSKLLQRADVNIWSSFAAYQILTQNYHNDHSHNMRLALDPWSGIVHPIMNDPVIGLGIFKNYVLPFETSSHTLLLLLNRSSVFIDSKYNKIIDYIKNSRILTEEANSIRGLENDISISEKRDIVLSRQKFKSINWGKSFKKKKIIAEKGKISRKKFASYLERHQKNIINKLYSQPNTSWHKNFNGFSLSIDGEIPVSDLIINYKLNAPKWIVLDKNNNGIVDVDEKKFRPNEAADITIPIKLYSNRVLVSDSTYDIYRSSKVKTINTKFNFISENSSKPYLISGSNPFSHKRFVIESLVSKAVLPNKYNVPIYNVQFQKNDNYTKEFSGTVNVDKNLILKKKIIIHPGTNFKLSPNVSMVFKNQVIAKGTPEKPIIFEKRNDEENSWGTIALQGKQTRGSKFVNVVIQDGSGGLVNQIRYTSMFSLHNTADIVIKKLKMKNNSIYDDMMHIIYCSNITIDDLVLKNIYSDAIDVDMSKKIIIKNATIIEPVNDSIDLMETEALIESSYMTGAGDKAISAGENSNIIINNSIFYKNNIGVASKDKSNVYILYSNFNNNKTQLSAYKKNWQYGGGGFAKIYRSKITGELNYFNSTGKSNITIVDSSIVGNINKEGENLFFMNNVDFSNLNKTSSKKNILIDHPLYSYILSVKNENERGSDIIKKKSLNLN